MSATLPLPLQPRESHVPRVSTALQVETPENVVLNYQLAGPAARCAAYLIDLLVRIGVIFALSIILGILACAGVMTLPFGGPSELSAMSQGAWLVVLFLINWLYFVILEWRWGGKSVGKHALGIRVIDQKGYPISFTKSALRNFLRAADGLPVFLYGYLFYGVGFLSMLLTRRCQRVGDLFAGTVVITERSVRLPREPIILERIQPLPHTEISSSFRPGQKTLALIDQFLGRRHVLTHKRGHALASVLAAKLAERMEYQGDPALVQQYPMAFLARVYVTYLKQADEDEDYGDEYAEFDSRVLEPRRRRESYR